MLQDQSSKEEHTAKSENEEYADNTCVEHLFLLRFLRIGLPLLRTNMISHTMWESD